MISIPLEIKKIINGLESKKDEVGCSDDTIINFEDKYILKISNDVKRLEREKNKIDWLCGKIPLPSSILFIVENEKAYYLRTCITGNSLISQEFLDNPLLLIRMLKKAITLLKKLDNFTCPFKSLESIGNEFVHGDLCLPNIFVKDGEISGFIDLDNSGLGDRWHDYAWMIWSFEYNLKTDRYTSLLLNELGIEFNEEKYTRYIPSKYR